MNLPHELVCLFRGLPLKQRESITLERTRIEMSTEAESAPKLSPVEGHKAESQFLRGTLAEELADPAVEHLSDMSKSLIKFHGSYQQEDRDARKNRGKAGVGKAYMFMIRLKLPGGKLTPDQYLGMDDLA